MKPWEYDERIPDDLKLRIPRPKFKFGFRFLFYVFWLFLCLAGLFIEPGLVIGVFMGVFGVISEILDDESWT